MNTRSLTSNTESAESHVPAQAQCLCAAPTAVAISSGSPATSVRLPVRRSGWRSGQTGWSTSWISDWFFPSWLQVPESTYETSSRRTKLPVKYPGSSQKKVTCPRGTWVKSSQDWISGHHTGLVPEAAFTGALATAGGDLSNQWKDLKRCKSATFQRGASGE